MSENQIQNVCISRTDELTSPTDAAGTIASLQQQIRHAAQTGRQLHIEGGGTRSDALPLATAAPLSLRDYQGIVQYEPDDLVITVRTGTALAHLQRVLAQERQMLGFEPPCRPGSTIGGTVALGWSGPRRPFAGALRDHLLGVRMLDGQGRDLRFGGQVVKNVAGFDVSRLMAGSLGVLGPMLEVSLRVVPRPAAEMTTVLALDAASSLALMQHLPTGPGLLTGAAHIDGCLYLRSGGSPGSVASFLRRQGGTLLDTPADQAFWHGLNNQTLPFFHPRSDETGQALPLWRLSVRPGSPDLAPGTVTATAIDWAGALRWVWAPMTARTALTQWTRAHGGHLALWRYGTRAEHESVQQAAIAPAQLALHRHIKDVFDPHGIFPCGHMFGPC